MHCISFSICVTCLLTINFLCFFSRFSIASQGRWWHWKWTHWLATKLTCYEKFSSWTGFVIPTYSGRYLCVAKKASSMCGAFILPSMFRYNGCILFCLYITKLGLSECHVPPVSWNVHSVHSKLICFYCNSPSIIQCFFSLVRVLEDTCTVVQCNGTLKAKTVIKNPFTHCDWVN